jgi:hypothetical protein
MGYRLDCDSCSYTDVVETEETAYTEASDHESKFTNHFVKIEAQQEL